MPSNKEYVEEAHELGAKLGIEVDTEGLNNVKLGELVSDLKAKERDLELDTQADKTAPAPPKVKKKKVKRPPYYVAEGKSITCKKGVLIEFDEIKAEYLGGGEAALTKLVNEDHVVES